MNGDGCRNRNDDCNTTNNKMIAVMIGAVISISPVLHTNTKNDDHELHQCDCGMMLVIHLIVIVVMVAP